MSDSDFEGCSLNEFAAVCKAYHTREETRVRREWEQIRMLATIVIQPWSKRRITPEKLLPFPWEKTARQSVKGNAPRISKEDAQKRFECLAGRFC